MPVFKSMFCSKLRSGIIVYGVLGLIALLYGFVLVIGRLVDNHNIIEGGKASYQEVFAFDAMDVGLKIALSVIVILIITHIMLILGATLNKKVFLIPWLFLTMIIAVLSFLRVIIYGIMKTDPGKDAAIYIFGLLFSVLYVYLWLCVLSFFQELQEEKVKDEDTISTADCNSPLPYATREAA